MTQQQTATVIDFTSYRVRRNRSSATTPKELAPSEWMFAVPVMMPVMIAWLPVWNMAGIAPSQGTGDE